MLRVYQLNPVFIMWNYGYRNLLVQPKKAVKTLVVSK